MTKKHSVVIGSGAWGTALAIHMANKGHISYLYCRRPAVASDIQTHNTNSAYLPDVSTKNVIATSDIFCIENADIVFIAPPSQYMKNVFLTLPIPPNADVILCCKGICAETLQPLSVVASSYHKHISVLSGPTIAKEVALGLPTAVTLTGDNAPLLKDYITSPNFRIYTHTDSLGACVYGACKNILAIASGITVGKQLGDNAKSALITRGIAEISRLNHAIGGDSSTAQHLCGIGDIILTCGSIQSRNMSFGIELGQGKSAHSILENRTTITEGAVNAEIVYKTAQKYNIDMPICTAVYNIICNNSDIDREIKNLLNRDN